MKKTRRRAAMLLLMLLSALPALAEILTGNCGAQGDNVTFSLDTESGVMVITGTGEMENFTTAEDRPWHLYQDQIKSVVINEGVDNIGTNAFNNCI